MKINVPYYSQQKDVLDDSWKDRACGVVSIKMVLDSYGEKIGREFPLVDNLIKEGVAIGAYSPEGWIHSELIALVRNHGLHAYNEEFRSLNIDLKTQAAEESDYQNDLVAGGIKKITENLKNSQPVIVSVSKHFKEKDKFHMIVLTGFEEKDGVLEGFYYHDPQPPTGETAEHLSVDKDTFIREWRKFAIFIYTIGK